MSNAFYIRKKSYHKTLENLRKNRGDSFENKIIVALKNVIPYKEDEYIDALMQVQINKFYNNLELALQNDIEICKIRSSGVYWSYHFTSTSFSSIWNSEYSKDYIIVDENGKVYSKETFLETIEVKKC